jgi:hypothetical protein
LAGTPPRCGGCWRGRKKSPDGVIVDIYARDAEDCDSLASCSNFTRVNNMSFPELDNKTIWRGVSTAYGETFAVELCPSKQYPGYYHIAVCCFADDFIYETKRPVRSDAVEESVSYFLKQHGLVSADMHWSKSETEKPGLAVQEND